MSVKKLPALMSLPSIGGAGQLIKLINQPINQSCRMLEGQVLWGKKRVEQPKGDWECLEVREGALGLQVTYDGQQSLPGEVILKQGLKEGEGISHVDTRGRSESD